MAIALPAVGFLLGLFINWGHSQIAVAKAFREADKAIARAAAENAKAKRLAARLDRYVALYGPLEVTDDVR